jgi:hypothetical protein
LAHASSDAGQQLKRSVYLGVQTVALQPFSLSGAPQQTVTPGGTAQYGIGVNCDPGFTGTVSLSAGAVTGGTLPSAWTIALNPTAISCVAASGNLSGTGSAILTIATTASTPTGTYSIRITGAGGSISLITGVQLIVNAPSAPGFTVQASPASQQLIPGGSTQAYTVTATGSNGFHDDVGLSAACVPAAVTAALTPNPITAAEGYSGTVTLTLAASQTNLIGDTATCTLTGTGDSATASATVWAQIVSAPAQYLLTTTVNPPGAGTITPSGWYDGGQSVPVSATPNGSYVFTGFTGGLTGATSPQYVTMNGPVSVTANFVNPTGLRVVSSTPYFLPFSVDGTPCATGSCLFSAQSGGDTLTVTQTAPPSTGRVPVFQYSAPDGSVAPQEIALPSDPIDPIDGGGNGCSWTCRNGSCRAPIPVGQPQAAPIIAAPLGGTYAVSSDPAGQNPAILYPGGPTLIYINGTNFGSVAGSVSFCTAGGSPCSFSEFLDSTEYLKPSVICPTCFWSNTQIEALVVVDPVDPQADAGTWLMYLNVPFWIAASDASHPSMGEVEMEAPPTVQITSRPITITASSTPGQYVATLTSVASPPGGSYAWTTSNPKMMGFDPSTPPSGPSSDHVKLVITSAGNNATITLTYNGPYGGTAADSFTFALTSDTTVVAWIDGSKIIPDATPLGGPNDIV